MDNGHGKDVSLGMDSSWGENGLGEMMGFGDKMVPHGKDVAWGKSVP
jgi:hypothetical protein